MLKRMKKVYDTEFYEVSKDMKPKEEKYYEINGNEDVISFNVILPSIRIFGLRKIASIMMFRICWNDDNLGIVVPVGKRAIQRRNIVGTISKVNNKKYFFLLKRMNCYA